MNFWVDECGGRRGGNWGFNSVIQAENGHGFGGGAGEWPGLSREEVAKALGLTVPTVKRDQRLAEAWLRRYLAGEGVPCQCLARLI